MRVIKFHPGANKKYQEAKEKIAEVEKEHPEIAEKMLLSFYQIWDRMLTMLFNGNIPKDKYGEEEKDYELHIASDFVVGSFSFVYMYDEKRDFNGGIILHGFGETFSVELTAPSHPHWSIHT